MVYKKGTLAKRVSAVEARQRNQRPQMKQILFFPTGSIAPGAALVTNISAITEGTNVLNRIGNRVKAWRVEMRGIMDPGLDYYLLQAHTNDTPAITAFSTSRGPFINSNDTNSKLTEWLHYSVADSVAHNFKRSKKFKYGLNIKYNGTAATNTVDNVLFIVVVNRSTTTQSIDSTVRLWFTDP